MPRCIREAVAVTTAIIAASATIAVAVIAFVLNQYGQARQERRQARLARINSQLRDLYGPLMAMVDVNEKIWESLRERHLPPAADRNPEGGDAVWRRWRDQVLQPTNIQMRDLIFSYADLVVEAEMPEVLRHFCAHVAAQEIVLAVDAEGLLESALIGHPGEMYVAYVRQTFVALKREQYLLLRRLDW